MKGFYVKISGLLLLAIVLTSAIVLTVSVPTTLNDFFLPGSQSGQSGNLEHPDKCDNCHGGYDQAVEPAFNWRGGMMSQAMRDPLYLASVAIANQDAPESGDLCIRCHAPDGWLNGRSTPTDGSALNNNDREGVQCDFCHKLVKPTPIGINPFPEDPLYLSSGTYQADQAYLSLLADLDGVPLIPPQSGNGMYIVDQNNAKRGPYSDAEAKHKFNYSPFHKESELCATCHDVSNPVYKKVGVSPNYTYEPNDFDAPSESFITYDIFPVERTYSEWLMSAYNTKEGVASDAFGGNKLNVSSCQDCHMQDVSGYGANKRRIPYRDDLPLHDLTGGNTFVPALVAELFANEVDVAALNAGVLRARYMLQNAATMEVVVENSIATVKIINNTGHKLPSGYPEGRRMWIQLKAFDIQGGLLTEFGAYEDAILSTEDTKVYEAKLGISKSLALATGLTQGESFHFVLNNEVIKDNRIPPLGFTNENFIAIQSPVVDYVYLDGANFDITPYNLPEGTDHVNVRLLYQTVSKEYIEFLRDENTTNDAGNLMYDLWVKHGKSAPETMQEVNVYLNGNPAPPDPVVEPIHARSVHVERVTVKGGKAYATARVIVTDKDNKPVFDAAVTGYFSGPSSKSYTKTTNSEGVVEFSSSRVKNPSDDWCFTVSEIVKIAYEFTAQVVACESSVVSARGINSGVLDIEQLVIYPNPASESVQIKFNLSSKQHVSLKAYRLDGSLLEIILDEMTQKGNCNKNWEIDHIPTGMYLIRLITDGDSRAKFILIK